MSTEKGHRLHWSRHKPVGLSCVRTRHAGIPEMLLENKQDLVVPEGKINALAGGLCWLAVVSVKTLCEMSD
jgi:hypothetical protein